MSAQSQRAIHDIWLHDDTEEDLLGADWHLAVLEEELRRLRGV